MAFGEVKSVKEQLPSREGHDDSNHYCECGNDPLLEFFIDRQRLPLGGNSLSSDSVIDPPQQVASRRWTIRSQIPIVASLSQIFAR